MNRSLARPRHLAASLLRSAAFGAAILLGAGSHAAAPMQKTQAPGYYRMMLGDFEVTAISDGTVALPMDKLLTNTSAADTQDALARSFLSSPVETSVNGYLVNTGTKLVLVDTGAGALFGPTLGKFLANLKASGYEPEQVDEIYITHMHADHVGGLTAQDARVYPNAIVRADKLEADYWLSQANMDAAPEEGKGFFRAAMSSLKPYVAAGKFQPFTGDTNLIAGVRATSTYGHTAGHTTYVVESNGQKLVVLGDLIHAGAVQFPDPSIAIQFDTDSKAAIAERKIVFAEAAKDRAWIAGAHLAFPGIGHLRTNGPGYVWVPANYSTLLH